MIESIRLEFKKIDKNTWSSSEYQVLVKLADYTEHYEDFLGEDRRTEFRSLESGLKSIKAAKTSIAKAEALLSFIETKSPERWQIVFFLDENQIRHSNHALNCLEVYL